MKKNLEKLLLTLGVLAGPFYIIVGLIEAFMREGFDITRHSLSLLSLGNFGWIHISLFILTGLLVISATIGIKKSLKTGIGHVWAPLLIGIYGLSLIAAGIFIPDASSGFPPVTPEGMPSTMSFHGIMHFMSGGIGFLSFIIACFILAKRFKSNSEQKWSIFSLATGIIFLLGFIGISSGSGNPLTIFGFWVSLIFAWTWLSLLSLKLKRKTI